MRLPCLLLGLAFADTAVVRAAEPPPAKELHALLAALDHADEGQRLGALRALAELGPKASAATEPVIRLFGDVSVEARLQAALTVGRFGKASALRVADELRAPNGEWRYLAALALGIMGPAGEAAGPALVRALADDVADVRRKAAYALGKMAHVVPKAVAPLAKLIADKDDDVRMAAFNSLLRFENLALDGAAVILDMPEPTSRAFGVRLLHHRFAASEKVALPHLLSALGSRHNDVRLACLDVLATTKNAPAVPLVKLLADDNGEVRRRALSVLSKQEALPEAKSALHLALLDAYEPVQHLAFECINLLKEDAFASLEKHLKLPAAADRFHAARLLLHRNPDSASAVAAHLRILREEKGILQKGAAYALGQSRRPECKPAIPIIAADLGNPDAKVRIAALTILYYIIPLDPDAALPGVAGRIKDSDYSVREMTAFALSRFDKKAWPVILQLAKDEHPGVRSMLYQSVGENGPHCDERLPFLMNALLSETSDQAKHGAIYGLSYFSAKTVAALMHEAYLAEKSPKSRQSLVQVACGFNATGAPAIPLFIEALKDSDARTRQLAASGLRAIGPEARAAIPALAKAQSDENPEVREAASAALHAIGK